MLESQRLWRQNPEDWAASRQPLIDFMRVCPHEMITPEVYWALGTCWYNDKEAESNIVEAQKVLKKGLEAFPDNLQLMRSYAAVMDDLEQFEEAASLYERCNDLRSAADSYYAAGNRTDVKRIYKELIDMSETPSPRWIQSMITICRETGALDEAVQYEAQFAELNALYSENEDSVYELNSVDVPPRAIRVFPPEYPFVAKLENIEGRIVVELVVTKEGEPKDPWVIDAEPPDIFEDAALEAVRKYRFAPGTRSGEAVDVRVKLPIHFAIDEEVHAFQIDPEPKGFVGMAQVVQSGSTAPGA